MTGALLAFGLGTIYLWTQVRLLLLLLLLFSLKQKSLKVIKYFLNGKILKRQIAVFRFTQALNSPQLLMAGAWPTSGTKSLSPRVCCNCKFININKLQLSNRIGSRLTLAVFSSVCFFVMIVAGKISRSQFHGKKDSLLTRRYCAVRLVVICCFNMWLVHSFPRTIKPELTTTSNNDHLSIAATILRSHFELL